MGYMKSLGDRLGRQGKRRMAGGEGSPWDWIKNKRMDTYFSYIKGVGEQTVNN